MSKNLYLLDCTLRDGGYVNDWNFNNDTAKNVLDLLDKAQVDIIECGILGKKTCQEETTKFNSIESMESLLKNKSPKCIYTVMLNFSERNEFHIKTNTSKSVDGIRLAFFKSEYKEALEYSKYLIKLGYLVFLQAMATYMYNEDELTELIEEVNNQEPFAFYMVDSFGTLFEEDIEKIYYIINKRLKENIVFGFHSHNNMQMAVSNSIKFINLGKSRKISVDVTVFGMGRGAGNAGTEIIMQYLNSKKEKKYNIPIVIEIFNKYLLGIYKNFYWGYSAECFLTAQKNMNSAYIWYLNQKGIKEINVINQILDRIPNEVRYYLNIEMVDKAIKEFNKKVD